MSDIMLKDLIAWCKIPPEQLTSHPALKIPFRLVKDSFEMGELMAREFVDDIKRSNIAGHAFRAIVPCGPKCWYDPFCSMINAENVSMRNVFIFHMDECLSREGRLLNKHHPYNFQAIMEKDFYEPVKKDLQVPVNQRFFPSPENIEYIQEKFWTEPVDLTLGGWGQDGHVAYNQASRDPFVKVSVDALRNSEIRVQTNNADTIIALAQRSFGCAYQLVPPMSITLGMKECLSAKKIRLFSDTGSWKQTALRVALFSAETSEYPITLLQSHHDALITATYETARHPVAENPEWNFEDRTY